MSQSKLSSLVALLIVVQAFAPLAQAGRDPISAGAKSRAGIAVPGRQDISPQEAEVEAATVNHGPVLNGRVEGSVRQLLGENVTFNSGGVVTSALLVPGTPTVIQNGTPTFGGTVQGTGSTSPSNFNVILNSGSTLGRLVTRVDPVAIPAVPAPPASTGTRDVSINSPGQSVGDFTTLRDLTLNSNVGGVTVPPGTYRNFTANSGSSFVFGVAGATQASVYNLNQLTINGGGGLQIVGPVVLTVAQNVTFNGNVGTSTNSLWLTLQVSSGNVTLNSGVSLFSVVRAPSGQVTVNGNSLLQGSVACDRLTVNGGGTVKGTAGVLQSISPASAKQGQSLTVTLQGLNTHWQQGQTVASFGGEVSVGGAAAGTAGPVNVTSNTTATANVVVSAAASLAPRTVLVKTPVASFSDGESESLINGFIVSAVSPPGSSSSAVTTIAGAGGTPGFANGAGSTARFQGLYGVAIGADDTIYIADSGNNRIRKAQNQSGVWTVSTLAGDGAAAFGDGAGASAHFNNPKGIAVDSSGIVYVADTGNNRIRKIATDGTVSTLAGTATAGVQNGAANQATFNAPQGVAVDNQGNLYVADTGNSTVRFISTSGTVSSVAGDGTIASNDSPSAHFNGLIGVAVDGLTAFIYLADSGNQRIRRLDPSGTVITLTGADHGFADGSAAQARFADPAGIAIDGNSRVIVADSTNSLIRQVDPSLIAGGSPSAVTTLAGTGDRGLTDGAGNVARFFTPAGVAVSPSSAIVVADTANQVIRRILLPPVIDAFSPTQATRGTSITIIGERFDARSPQKNTVNFAKSGGGTTQATVTAATRSQLTVTIPTDAVTGTVTVQTEGGTATSATAFTVQILTPVISDFNPKSGEIGSAVSIFGSFLSVPSGGTTITFAGNAGVQIPALITSLTPTQANVIVPNGAMTGLINLKTPFGTATTAVPFTVSPGQQDYQLALAPSSTTVVQGGQSVFVVYLTAPSPTFGQLSTLTASGLPGGVQATFSPQQITAGAQSTLTLDLSTASLAPGTYPFTVGGNALVNGAPLVRTASASFTVMASGQTTLSGRVLSTDALPILGATISLDGQTATTDAAGSFLLSGIGAGASRPLMIDGRTASAPNRTYPVIAEPANIVQGQANRVPFTFYLPPIDTQYEVQVVPGQDTQVTNPTVPGLVMTIPAGAHLRNRDGSAVARASITPVPIDRTPAPLPANVPIQLVYTSQPGAAISDVAIPVVYPNLAGLDPGTTVPLYDFNHDTVQWEVYGQGQVSADGLTIQPKVNPATGKLYGLTTFSWHGPNAAPSGDSSPTSCGGQTDQPVDLSTGQKIERMVDVQFGGARGGIGLERVFTSDLAALNVFGRFGRGWKDSFDVKLTGSFNSGGAGRVVFPELETGRLFSYIRTDPDGSLVFANSRIDRLLGDVLRKLADGTFQYRYKTGEMMRFDGTGKLMALVDRNQNTTMLTYDGSGKLTNITDPVGRSVAFAYNSQGLVSTITDPIGRTCQYTYDNTQVVSGGQLVTVTDPLGKSTRYGYTLFQLTSVTDKRGNVVKQISYDANGRVARQNFAEGGSQTYSYGLSGSLVTSVTISDSLGRTQRRRFNGLGYTLEMTDALGQTTQFQRDIGSNLAKVTVGPCGCGETTRQFDTLGNVVAITDRLGNTARFTYEPTFNQMTSVTDQLGRMTTLGYDANGNLTSVNDALNHTMGMGYDQFGERVSVTDELGHTRQVQYDRNGSVSGLVDALGNTTTLVSDAVNRSTLGNDPLGRSTSIIYDSLDRPLTLTDTAGVTTSFGYDENGNLVTTTNALGRTWTKSYDKRNRMVSETDPLNRVETMVYDTEGQLLSEVSPSGRTMRYTYDPRGLLATIADPLQGLVAFSYDNRRNLTALVDQRGNTTTYGYDELYRAISTRDPLGKTSTAAYDAVGNLTSAVDRLGRHTTATYDAINRLASLALADATISYSYDAASRPTAITDSQSGSISWAYDSADRLLTETTTSGAVGYTYNAANQHLSMTAADRTPVTYAYDTAGRVSTITQGAETFTYGYDSLSRPSSLQRPNGVVTSTAYDVVNRTTDLAHAKNPAQPIEHYSYTYNLDDEISSITSLASTMLEPSSKSVATADGNNRVPQSGPASFTFNDEGQTTSKTDATGTTQYTWDVRGRMTSAAMPNGQAVLYSYDALGRRASRTDGSGTTSFLYDGVDVVTDKGPGGSAVDYLNGWGIDDKLRQSGPSGPVYFLQDHLGSTTALTDATGTVAERLQYDPFGGSPGSAFTRYTFTGREQDAASGLLFLRARWYDPNQGRFLTDDPMDFQAGDTNLYAYVGNDPVLSTDPFGLEGDNHQAELDNIFSIVKKILKQNQKCRQLLSTDPSLCPAGSEPVKESDVVGALKRMKQHRFFFTNDRLAENVADTTGVLTGAFIRIGPEFFDPEVGGWAVGSRWGAGRWVLPVRGRVITVLHEIGHANIAAAAGHYVAPENATPAQKARQTRETIAYNKKILRICLNGVSVPGLQ
jgi:RHS repeat-associated protein